MQRWGGKHVTQMLLKINVELHSRGHHVGCVAVLPVSVRWIFALLFSRYVPLLSPYVVPFRCLGTHTSALPAKSEDFSPTLGAGSVAV